MDDQLAKWLDPTPLTLEVLTAELGEPDTYCGADHWWLDNGERPRDRLHIQRQRHGGTVYVDGFNRPVLTIGQRRRVLSVMREVHG